MAALNEETLSDLTRFPKKLRKNEGRHLTWS